MKFCGKYSGKYNRTEINVVNGSTVITPSKGTAEVTISEVGCGAYLISIIKDGDSSDPKDKLAYLEKNVLRASAYGHDIVSAYFEDNRLIIQLSSRRNSTEWEVVNFSFKKCKC
jgi:hypothetical protein